MQKPERSYRDLIIWNKAIILCQHTYAVTESFPRLEQFGLVSQMRRAAVSIPSNIAEGRSRSTAKDFAHFLHVALGSLAELDTQYEIAVSLHFCSQTDRSTADSLLIEIRRMLHAMIRKLEARA